MARLHVVEENPYPSRVLNYLDYMSIQGMRVFKIPMDITVSCLFMTTKEKSEWYLYVHRYILVLPIGFLLMILTMPINILAFALWLAIHRQRKLYRLSYCGKARKSARDLTVKRLYTFMTTNVCLMPECMARFNNFSESWTRCQRMGEILARRHTASNSHVVDIMDETTDSNHNHSKQSLPKANLLFRNGFNITSSVHGRPAVITPQIEKKNVGSGDQGLDVSVIDYMPDADFILLQEASWDMQYAKTLVRELHNVYPYVVYDIGKHSLTTNLCVGNSGLMLASKYDILDVRFNLFESSCKQCRFASKGLLQLKVYLGRSPTGQDVVGYIYNTHLQAYKGDRPIQNEQMDSILKWTEEFRNEYQKADEIVAFDILGGDFNLDNMSPVDKDSYNHKLFKRYFDVGRETEGIDHDWAKGTELRQSLLYDSNLSTPTSLKRVLDDPILMQTYLLDGDLTYASLAMATSLAKRDAQGKIIPSPVGGKRRIDYILVNQADSHVQIQRCNPVTALANLTDHIPVALSLDVSRHSDLTEAFVD